MGEDIKTKGKLYNLYMDDVEDNKDKENNVNDDTYVLTLIPNHLIAPFGTTLS